MSIMAIPPNTPRYMSSKSKPAFPRVEKSQATIDNPKDKPTLQNEVPIEKNVDVISGYSLEYCPNMAEYVELRHPNPAPQKMAIIKAIMAFTGRIRRIHEPALNK